LPTIQTLEMDIFGFDTDNLTEDDIDTILIYQGGVFPELLEGYGELKFFEENISKEELLAFLLNTESLKENTELFSYKFLKRIF
jgi:hypothetical protein